MAKVRDSKVQVNQMQGEGNYEAAERFNKAERAFVKSGKVTLAAPNTAPKSQKEAQELLQAEQAAKDHPKGKRMQTAIPLVQANAQAHPVKSATRNAW